MFLNAYAIQEFLDVFEHDPHDEETVTEARRAMVAHCSTSIWRDHGSNLVSLFSEDFRSTIVTTYAALIRNETVQGHHHATFDFPAILEEAQQQLAPHARATWLDRHVWRL
jgi:hypothetical protein